jgi:hypothetical protein
MVTITKDDIEKARMVSIIDYVDKTGMGKLIQSGKYYRLHYAGHDSIVIDSEKNRFYHNSTNEKGDVIYFLEYFEGKSFVEAVSELSDGNYKDTELNKIKNTQPKEPFKLPDYLTIERDYIDDYLTNERCISKSTVDYFYRKGMIKQDKIGQVYFLWKPSGTIEQGVVGGSKVNSENGFKGILKNSQENFGFNVLIGNAPESHFYFESAIDLISFYDLNKDRINNARLCSLEGVKVQTLYNFIANSFKHYQEKPSDIYIATDNDKAGIIFWQEMNDQPIKYQDNQRLDYINLIPHYTYYDKELLTIYHQVAGEHDVDWRILASIHKYETNCSLSTEAMNSKSFSKYFGHSDTTEDCSYNEIKLKAETLVKDIYESGLSFDDFIDKITKDNNGTKNEIKAIYSELINNRFIPVNVKDIQKDWNDVSKITNPHLKEIERGKLKDEYQLHD